MRINLLRMMALVVLAQALALTIRAEDKTSPYPKMFPVEQYLMPDRDAEIALAQNAAPASIAKDARVLVLGRHGYDTAVEGKNGFVCLVERSWASGVDDTDFWNPKLRGPICLNPAAARSYLPISLKKTELILAGKSKAEMVAGVSAALDRKEIPPLERGAMCYMLSRQGYLNDRDGHWHPHLMFFVPLTEPAAWGADASDSPVIGMEDKQDRMTVFLVPVAKWSDGTDAAMKGH